ncbi:probable leucine-rich repeat receptor-like protein kinase At5g49770 [Eucalyptus grandis]|uniref:probable leucine-rich repeat receptor-like protein kinase At5g49770 n=1 Tax=Eucalyptus grandis TaxID=71139 RepID=UPI00192EE6D3|nr:probable leucine-rich repeat receptor-like protein kinase At5g49770 [Eucalyptus grandis]
MASVQGDGSSVGGGYWRGRGPTVSQRQGGCSGCGSGDGELSPRQIWPARVVYRGTLPSGTPVAIKRAQQGSMQGGVEFKNEIELLSRVHHKNLVSLVGFCSEHGEQLLVYEFLPNGTIKESLSGFSSQESKESDRDIKSTNILLDDHLNAKVADFGVSKPMGDGERGHVTTQVKGTMGYLDPEYYMTEQLTEKSDVYSFRVLMLELLTARRPIEQSRYIVREVRVLMNKDKDLYNLQGILDPAIGLGTSLKGLERFVELAMRCVEESGADRPTMGEVVKEIENIMVFAGLNPKAESATTSASYEEASKGYATHPYHNEDFSKYSGGFPPSRIEPQ